MNQEPYFNLVEQQCRKGKRMLPPWVTSDPALLKMANQYFPDIPIYPTDQLGKPDLTPVEILPLTDDIIAKLNDQKDYFIAVGGPPAATVGLQAAIQGSPVLYINDYGLHASSLPIWSGAGNHGEPDALTEAPAYTLGYTPFKFIFREMLRLLHPTRDIKHITHPDYPWLRLNIIEWLNNPRQWLAGWRVAWGNHQLAKRYQHSPDILKMMRKRVQDSSHYLMQLHQKIGALIREPRGSLMIAASPRQLANLSTLAERLRAEGNPLKPLTPEQAEERFGIKPRQALAIMEKTRDFIFEPDFLTTLTKSIAAHGGQVITHWRLTKVFIDTQQKKGGVLEFYELTATGEKKFHYRKFHHAHLSLGATPFVPRIYDLISVTGVTMNALIVGAALKGGPIVCGGVNHIVPLLPPQTIQSEPVSFVRLSAAACVNPLDRGNHWYHYDGHHALHLLHCVRETLPENVTVKILSVRGCNRVIGKDGHQVELQPTIAHGSLTIQIGAGGGGLTQMGAVPQQMKGY